MKRFTSLIAIALILGAFAALPAVAEEASAQPRPEATEEAGFTPMEGPQQQGLITVDDLRKMDMLRLCDPDEVEMYCPGCFDCIITATKVTCIC
jgi:hypothetical protein